MSISVSVSPSRRTVVLDSEVDVDADLVLGGNNAMTHANGNSSSDENDDIDEDEEKLFHAIEEEEAAAVAAAESHDDQNKNHHHDNNDTNHDQNDTKNVAPTLLQAALAKGETFDSQPNADNIINDHHGSGGDNTGKQEENDEATTGSSTHQPVSVADSINHRTAEQKRRVCVKNIFCGIIHVSIVLLLSFTTEHLIMVFCPFSATY
jgi:hypothetical protein